MATNTTPEPATTDLQTAYRAWQEACRDGKRITPLLHAVYDYLHDGTPLTAEQLMGVACMTRLRLSFRDAIIVAAFRPDRVDPDMMEQFTLSPHSEDSGRTMGMLLNGSFDRAIGWDATVVARLDRLMADADALIPENAEQMHAQPDAVRAYIAWWAGENAQAFDLAMRAKEADPDCTLAAIVATAVIQHVTTAVARKH